MRSATAEPSFRGFSNSPSVLLALCNAFCTFRCFQDKSIIFLPPSSDLQNWLPLTPVRRPGLLLSVKIRRLIEIEYAFRSSTYVRKWGPLTENQRHEFPRGPLPGSIPNLFAKTLSISSLILELCFLGPQIRRNRPLTVTYNPNGFFLCRWFWITKCHCMWCYGSVIILIPTTIIPEYFSTPLFS